MRFRTGLLIGLGVGYVLGTRDGRERYEQIQAGIRSLADGELGQKVRAGIDLGLERIRNRDNATVVVIDETIEY